MSLCRSGKRKWKVLREAPWCSALKSLFSGVCWNIKAAPVCEQMQTTTAKRDGVLVETRWRWTKLRLRSRFTTVITRNCATAFINTCLGFNELIWWQEIKLNLFVMEGCGAVRWPNVMNGKGAGGRAAPGASEPVGRPAKFGCQSWQSSCHILTASNWSNVMFIRQFVCVAKEVVFSPPFRWFVGLLVCLFVCLFVCLDYTWDMGQETTRYIFCVSPDKGPEPGFVSHFL